MDDNKYHEEEISLKELLTALFNGRRLIALITIAFAVLSIILSFVILKPAYETELSFVMNIPATVETKVGVYEYITTSPNDYLPILMDKRLLEKTITDMQLDSDPEKLSKSIEYTNNEGSKDQTKKGIVMTVKGNDPNLISDIANTHMANYIQFLNLDFKEKAIDKFLKDYRVRLDVIDRDVTKYNSLIDKNIELLKNLSPVITLQKALTSNPEVAARYAKDRGLSVKDLTGSMLYDELSNPDYTKVSSSITDYKMAIASLTAEKENLEDMVSILTSEEKAMVKFKENGDASQLKDGFLQVFDTKIQIVSPAAVPLNPVGPRKALNLAIALVLGVMVGAFVVLFRSYWDNN